MPIDLIRFAQRGPYVRIALVAVFAAILGGCWDDDPCDPGQKPDGLFCVPIPPDAGIRPVVPEEDSGTDGMEPAPITDPEVAACADQVLASVPAACKACVCTPEACRPNVIESKCNQACWDLMNCTNAMCPDFAQNPMDFSCLASKCSAYLGGGIGAMAAGMCVIDCSDACYQ